MCKLASLIHVLIFVNDDMPDTGSQAVPKPRIGFHLLYGLLQDTGVIQVAFAVQESLVIRQVLDNGNPLEPFWRRDVVFAKDV